MGRRNLGEGIDGQAETGHGTGDSKCEGRVSVDDLDGSFDFDEERYDLVNSKTREIFRLGDEVEVLVAQANLVLRRLDFEFVKRIKGSK